MAASSAPQLKFRFLAAHQLPQHGPLNHFPREKDRLIDVAPAAMLETL
jgi:hypothetical protein